MIRSITPIHSNGSTTLRNFHVSPNSFYETSTSAMRVWTMHDLRNSNVPPLDHDRFTLPEKSVRLVPGFVNKQGTVVRCESLSERRKVTREDVQEFYSSGSIPEKSIDVQALAIFLLTNKLFGALAWLVVRSNSSGLELANCALGIEGVGNVLEWVKAIPFKVTLDLTNNGIDAEGAALLAKALEADAVTHLNLDGNPLGDKGVEFVCAALERNASLLSLSIGGVGAGSLGIQAIARLLDSHPSLSVLNLNANAFDNDAAAGFAAALGHNKILTDLFMSHSKTSDEGLSIVASALKTNTALNRISLSGLCRLGRPVLPAALVEMLGQALLVNKTMTCFDSPAEEVTAADANRLAGAIAQNSTLRYFSTQFMTSPQTSAAQQQIEDKLKANALIEAAGNALFDLSQLPESTVPIPLELGQSIAAFVAQVAADESRREAIRSVVQAGPFGLQIPFA